MTPYDSNPLRATLGWLTKHARFPASRLDSRAEVLLCFAAAAAADDIEVRRRYLIESRDSVQTAALRAHEKNRALARYKCDNSTKL
jgi:hypothetical protein